MNPTPSAPVIPAHVPAHLVGTYTLLRGVRTTDNPYETIIPKMHEGPEVIWSPNAYSGFAPAWVFRRAADMQAVYMDTEHFSSKDFAPFSKLLQQNWNLVPAEIDPPAHGMYRSMVNPLFTPRRMAQLENRVREFARQYIANFKDKGRCEFMEEFAFRFPINVFLELMGLPMEQVETFLTWENGLLHEADIKKVAHATQQVRTYLLEQIEDRRRNPRDDLISFGIGAEVDGRKMTDDELFGFCFNLFIGGMDTVSTNMAWHFRHLAEHPEDQAKLRAHPELIPAAVEEMFRAYSAVTTARNCVKPVQIRGVQLMPGDKVLMSTVLANRDPEAFENPNEVRFDRNPRHLTFGTGIHRCVGAPLARREIIFAIEEFLRAIPEFRIAPDEAVYTQLGGVIQPENIPLVWKT